MPVSFASQPRLVWGTSSFLSLESLGMRLVMQTIDIKFTKNTLSLVNNIHLNHRERLKFDKISRDL